MNLHNLLYTVEGDICIITINRPDKLNALNKETISEVGMAIDAAVQDADVRGIIITGSGSKAFVAGADISEFASYNLAQGMELSAHGHAVFNKVEHCPKPVIAAVNGFALGGGCELAMACHMRVAASNARFGQPEVKLGLIPGYAGTQRLPQLIGKGRAMELLMTADMIDAAEAHRLGLVNHVTEPDQLLDTCRAILTKISAQAPLAISEIIRTVNAYYDKTQNGFQTEIERFGACFTTEDVREGTDAFLNKRKAEFKGR
ncbi:MAG: enoyl-CoA hydratase-related protein [Sphingobacteriales bacterium]|jgi:enoyl-CoA hydratase|nr:enoyl-CoA hydratase-related protein [Sphingobacteriales bacterium]